MKKLQDRQSSSSALAASQSDGDLRKNQQAGIQRRKRPKDIDFATRYHRIHYLFAVFKGKDFDTQSNKNDGQKHGCNLEHEESLVPDVHERTAELLKLVGSEFEHGSVSSLTSTEWWADWYQGPPPSPSDLSLSLPEDSSNNPSVYARNSVRGTPNVVPTAPLPDQMLSDSNLGPATQFHPNQLQDNSLVNYQGSSNVPLDGHHQQI